MYWGLLLGRMWKSHPLILNARLQCRNFFNIFLSLSNSSSRSLAFGLDLVQHALVDWRLVELEAFIGVQQTSNNSELAAILQVPLGLEVARERVEIVGRVDGCFS